MLLLHQVGSVKIGEVVRYTVTYHSVAGPNPAVTRETLPSDPKYFHYCLARCICPRPGITLSVSAYPVQLNPNEKYPNPRRSGVPEFEPMLKAGGLWECELVVPDDIRQTGWCRAAWRVRQKF
ncbi:hypothetical protein J3459_010260 [Metarhizium acridum]|nr:hypothetical protein J3459_010260 [Metarhizium acridum]